jgi:hypothetical protein
MERTDRALSSPGIESRCLVLGSQCCFKLGHRRSFKQLAVASMTRLGKSGVEHALTVDAIYYSLDDQVDHMTATMQPLFSWLDIDMMGQKEQGGVVVHNIVCNELFDLVTDLVLSKDREQCVLESSYIVTVRRLQREQNSPNFEIAVQVVCDNPEQIELIFRQPMVEADSYCSSRYQQKLDDRRLRSGKSIHDPVS